MWFVWSVVTFFRFRISGVVFSFFKLGFYRVFFSFGFVLVGEKVGGRRGVGLGYFRGCFFCFLFRVFKMGVGVMVFEGGVK